MDDHAERELTRIEELKAQKYMTRAEIMDNIDFPKSNKRKIIILSNAKGTGFIRNSYEKRYLKGVLSETDFYVVLDNACKIMAEEYSKKRKTDNQQLKTWVKILYLLAFVFLGCFWLSANETAKYNLLWLDISSYFFLILSVMCVIIITLYNFKSEQRTYISYNHMIKKRLGHYFEKINLTHFRKRKLEWFLIEGHYWIELRIMKNSQPYDIPKTPKQ